MKRKRGHKKGKGDKPSAAGMEESSPNIQSIDVEGDTDEDGQDNDESATPVAAEPSSSTVTEQPTKPPSVFPERPIQRPVTTAVYGRVKVRLKTPKTLESKVTPLEGPIHSDTHSSSGHQKSVDKQDNVPDKVEDSANSIPNTKVAAGETLPGKADSIKINSSKSMATSSMNQGTGDIQNEQKLQHVEPKLPHQDPRYNKEELDAALEVIKKVMKMDAAEPFNVPVNPIELGIPDYFDVIDTPMDFGTVRSNLESGTKYVNSESVYRDVRYIWDNCYKYNNKGDYIVDLMRRVKKNFAKYWAAAGLYSDQSKKGNGVEGIPAIDGGSSSHDKKHKKGKGVKKHKDGCMCAICIMKRRRKEREAREARESKGQGSRTPSGISDPGLAQGCKSEENTLPESPYGDDLSSSMETSRDADADEDAEDAGDDVKSEAAGTQHNSARKPEENDLDAHGASVEVSETSQGGNRTDNESYPANEPKLLNDSGPVVKAGTEKHQPVYIEAQTSTLQKRKLELLEAEKKRRISQLYEGFRQLESPTLAGLCNTLFPDNPNTVWEGPHSLVHRKAPLNNTKIHAAVSSLMSPLPKKPLTDQVQ